jgi:hypothetical protein
MQVNQQNISIKSRLSCSLIKTVNILIDCLHIRFETDVYREIMILMLCGANDKRSNDVVIIINNVIITNSFLSNRFDLILMIASGTFDKT